VWYKGIEGLWYEGVEGYEGAEGYEGVEGLCYKGVGCGITV
jgi:hypothetical protein